MDFGEAHETFPVKVVRISSCTTFFSKSFTLLIGQTEETKSGVSKSGHKKAPENKAPKRAGATPLFGLQSAQKVFEVAPARFEPQTRSSLRQKGLEPHTC